MTVLFSKHCERDKSDKMESHEDEIAKEGDNICDVCKVAVTTMQDHIDESMICSLSFTADNIMKFKNSAIHVAKHLSYFILIL